MRAMILSRAGAPLQLSDTVDLEEPQLGEVIIRVHACGVCRTDLHITDGELDRPKLPLILGHEIVGTVCGVGSAVTALKLGDRIGIPWLGWTCGACDYCRTGRENLCESARFTGYQIDGGYAEMARADARFCFRLPPAFGDVDAAPLLCAGLIGYRALKLVGDADRVGLYGFGAAAHIAVQVARHRGQRVYAFTKPGDRVGQDFARALGAEWAGGSDELSPVPLDGALIFAPVGALVPAALAATAKGGTVVCAGIHMSDIPSFPYRLLWHERIVRSVANLTREDGEEFLALAAAVPVRTTTEAFPLAEANEALYRLRTGAIEGAAVLVP
ncbi:MAG TPA: zinc-dependent alcohol dehydrogenase family protein [Stellaceae bacterium]|nr:zinc-dependent alcohol dehydrogenase family protein [Stellaceae bacterium]